MTTMADELEDQQQGDDANQGGSELAQLNQLIAADEAVEASQKQAAGEQAERRDSNGRFKSATDGAPRAGQRQTPAEINAAAAKAKASATAAKAGADATQTVTTPGAKAQEPGSKVQGAEGQ